MVSKSVPNAPIGTLEALISLRKVMERLASTVAASGKSIRIIRIGLFGLTAAERRQ